MISINTFRNNFSHQKRLRKRSTQQTIRKTFYYPGLILCTAGLLAACDGGIINDEINRYSKESQSSSIALTSDDRLVVVVNREADSASIIEVRNSDGEDSNTLIAELQVGIEPRYVAISPNNQRAFVSNAQDSSISVIELAAPQRVLGKTIKVGAEPRGVAFTPNGAYAFVANHTAGTVSVIDTKNLRVINTVVTGGNPMAIAVSNDGDEDDYDEKVYVTRFFAELIDPARPDGFDDAKQGVIDSFDVADASEKIDSVKVSQILLAPMSDSGFTNDRRQFCLKTRASLQSDGRVSFFPTPPNQEQPATVTGVARLANEVFCPDTYSSDASATGPIANTLQGVYPNLIAAVMMRGTTLFSPNIGVQPEPPVFFENNVQALVSSYDTATFQDLSINLNAQIQLEDPIASNSANGSLDRVFASDLVAIDANAAGDDFLIVSRGGSYVLRANLDEDRKLNIGAPDAVTRFQTGSMPTGVVMSSDGTRAYTNNEINRSVTSIDLTASAVLTRDIHASTPPLPGTAEHRVEVGKLAFFTALGIEDSHDSNGDGNFDIAIRDIVPANFRNKASNSGWSSCASCHEDGRTDNVTWIFPTGPVQTVPMEGTFAKNNIRDQRILNWNAVRGSITDFNNNSRGIQGGTGFATNVNGVNRTGEVFNHGPTENISDALDAMTEWTTTIRALNMPQADKSFDLAAANSLFEVHCASCHGGAKWTKSSTSLYTNNPTFTENPIGAGFFTAGPTPGKVPTIDAGLTIGGSSIVKLEHSIYGTLTFLDDVGTFDSRSILGIRGAGAIAGQSTQGFPALGATGFNTPSLLGVGYHAPYLHDGSAEDLDEVFKRHNLPAQAGATIEDILTIEERALLEKFLNSIDDNTPIFALPFEQLVEPSPVE